MKKKVYLWLLAMCVTAGTATPVYAVEPVAEQSTVEENTGNVEENQEQEKASENNGENFGEENSGEVKAPENGGVNPGEVKAPENSGVNSGWEKEPENGGVNPGEGKDTENSGENAVEKEKSGEVAEVPEDELALQELGEEYQIAAFSNEETLTVTDLTELLSALDNENCKKIEVNGSFDVTQKLTVNRELTIYGGTSGATLNRGAKDINLFYVESSGKLTLENITIDGKKGTYQDCKPLIYTTGTLTLEKGAVLQNNHAQYVGSAIQAMGGSLIMNGGFIQDNETAHNGGGISLGQDATFKMTGGTIQRNTGDGGGGIDAQCQVTMTGGTIQNNTATRCGGGIMLNRSGSGLVMSGGSITGNHAKASSRSDSGNGGGVYANSGTKLTLSNGASIENNTAEKNGGGVYAYSSATLTLNGGTIAKNKAEVYGGGVYAYSSMTLTLDGGKIQENTAKSSGGGVYVNGQVTMTSGEISGNQSTEQHGGGIMNYGTVNINGGTITNNTSSKNGGGIFNQGLVTMTAGTISGNTSTNGSGGGIFSPATLKMSGGSITGNTANSKGGGIYQGNYFQVSGETVQITGNTVNGGNASNVFLNRASDGTCYYVEIASSGLSGNSKMGVSIGEGKDLNITQAVNDADYSNYFTSDDSNYEIMNVESNGKYQVSLKKTGSGNTGGSESGGSTGGNTGGSESGGTTGGNNGGNTSGSTTGTSGGSSAGTAASTPATTTPKETTITVPLQADTQESTLETGNLPTNLQQRVLNQKISHTVLSSTETGVKVGLDIEAVRSISGQAQGDASVVVQKLDNTALKGSAAAVIGTRPVVTVRVQDAAGKAITDLGAGSVLVEIPYVLQNGENPGNICAVSTDAEGNVQWILNSVYDSEKQVLRFRTLQGADYGVASIPVGIYQDTVGTDKQADIAFAVSRGLLTGDAKGQAFDPEKAVTMEEFSTALDRMTGKKVSDVVLGNFVPTQSITREDMAVLLVKYADTLGIILPKVQTANAFADQNRIQTEALSAVQLLQQAEVLEAKENQNFAPKEEVTRAECCTTLRLFMEMMVKGTCRTN